MEGQEVKTEVQTQPTIKEMLAVLADRIANYRWAKRKTLDQQAAEAKVSSVLLSNLENNALESITLSKLLTVANSVGVNLKIVFEETVPIERREQPTLLDS